MIPNLQSFIAVVLTFLGSRKVESEMTFPVVLNESEGRGYLLVSALPFNGHLNSKNWKAPSAEPVAESAGLFTKNQRTGWPKHAEK